MEGAASRVLLADDAAGRQGARQKVQLMPMPREYAPGAFARARDIVYPVAFGLVGNG